MSWLSTQQIADFSGGALLGDDVAISAVSTDSRRCQDDELFIALHGERFDAHDFINKELKAAALMVHMANDDRRPQVLVEDTRVALGQLASSWRSTANKPLIALTGSNGKTTVKQMIASIFSQNHSVLATEGNFNNDIGVPLTLLRGRDEDYWVIEMGANHHGEIKYLTHIVKPDVALVNNAAEAHLEGFGSVKGVSEAKGEIYQGLSEGGIAIVNEDDQYADYWKELNQGRRVITFGFYQSSDVQGDWNGQVLKVSIDHNQFTVNLSVHGKHNAANALAACACALAMDVSMNDMCEGLNSFVPASGRLQQYQIGDAMLINDAYNANPASFKAAIQVLQGMKAPRVLVMGDMRELGDDTDRLHGEIGQLAKQAGIESLITLGESSKYAARDFGDAAQVYQEIDDVIAALKEQFSNGAASVLVKGSRGMAMERVIDAFVNFDKGDDHVA